MKTALNQILASLGLQTATPYVYAGFSFEAALTLKKQEDEAWEEYDRCTGRIEEIDERIAELQLEIPKLKKLAMLQKTLRVLTAPLRWFRIIGNHRVTNSVTPQKW